MVNVVTRHRRTAGVIIKWVGAHQTVWTGTIRYSPTSCSGRTNVAMLQP